VVKTGVFLHFELFLTMTGMGFDDFAMTCVGYVIHRSAMFPHTMAEM
jgi:hypothetical protein